MKKNVLLITGFFLLLAVMSCKKNGSIDIEEPLTVTDADGNIYPTVTIGNQVWMAKNFMGTKTASGAALTSYAPNNDPANIPDFGRLYHWADAKAAVPAGWRLPTDADWQALISTLGGNSIAGGKLKHTTLWAAPNTGATNSSGFNMPGAGYRLVFPVGGNLIFAFRNYTGYWAEKDGSGNVNVPTFGTDRENVQTLAQSELMGYSIRYIKN